MEIDREDADDDDVDGEPLVATVDALAMQWYSAELLAQGGTPGVSSHQILEQVETAMSGMLHALDGVLSPTEA